MKLSHRSSSDVLIIGGGNAALCAAITAKELGCSVTLLESAPKVYRGGNSRHTRNFRCMHDQPMGVLVEHYKEDEYFNDLLKVTKGKTDEALAKLCIRSSEQAYHWMQTHGVHFQPSLSGTLSLSRTNAFFLGGGKALVNAYYRVAKALGVHILYEASVEHLNYDDQQINEVLANIQGELVTFYARSVVVASGGFQADLNWLTQAWGKAAQNFLIRGTPYNRGVVLKDLLDQGIESVGDPTQCHAVAIDGRSPKYDGGIVTRLDCVPFSVVLNKEGKRFYDEGEDVWPKRYAIWGRLVASQPDQVAYAIIDSNSLNLFMPSVFAPTQAETIEELANKMNLPVDAVKKTIQRYNQACQEGNFLPTELDGLCTEGITPAKTNWARPIKTPPFYGYELRPGVTFTYLGLKVNSHAQVLTPQGEVRNLWAAGEIMAGSILGEGYLAGFGMTIGTVFGRIAGEEAAKYAK